MTNFKEEIEKISSESHIPGIRRIDSVLFEFSRNPINSNRFDLIMMANDKMGNGMGSKVMNVFTKLADKHNVEIYLTAIPILHNSPENAQRLIKWYARNGFSFDKMEVSDNWVECGMRMTRSPNSKEFIFDADELLPLPKYNDIRF